MSKVPKIRSLHIFAIFPEKSIGYDEVDFLLADKHKSFLQVDNINLVARSQGHPKIFAISKGKQTG